MENNGQGAKHAKDNIEGIHLLNYALTILLFWTIAIVASLLWNIQMEENQTRELALNKARETFNKDEAFRLWAASHGGVYVPITEKTPPNPNLSHVKERDIVTPSGKKLTLMNPAYMVRQTMDDYSVVYGIKGKITSLNPIRAENAPDEWERRALQSFEKGSKEVFEFVEVNGEPHVRLMQPLNAKEHCLKCHGFQGYKVGDIRGGIGVSVPLKPLLAAHEGHLSTMYLSHGLIWMLGFIGTGFGTWRAQKNIIRRKAAETETQTARMEWERTFDALEDPVMILDTGYKIKRANTAMADALGKTKEEAVGLTCYEEVHGTKCPIERCPHQALLQDGQPHTEEIYEERLGGHFLVSVSPIFDSTGRLVGSVHQAHDITERKKAADIIKASAARLTEAQEIAHIGSWELDLTENVLHWSDEIYNIFEIDPEKFGATYEAFLNAIHPDDREMVNKAYTDSLKNKTPYEITHRLLMPDGRIKHVNEQCKTYYGTDGKPVRSMGTVQDITEHKRAEDQIKKSLREKELLLMEIHHRVNNNMAVASGLLGIQAKEVKSEEVRVMFEESQNRLKSMALVHGMFYEEMDFTNINFADYINKLTNMLYESYHTDKSRIAMNITAPETSMMIDIALPCGLILNELISNCFKHAFPDNKSGNINISFNKNDEGIYKLIIDDDGTGLPEGFDLKKSSTIGLRLINTLIQQLEGEIEFSSEGGAKFVITFRGGGYVNRIRDIT